MENIDDVNIEYIKPIITPSQVIDKYKSDNDICNKIIKDRMDIINIIN